MPENIFHIPRRAGSLVPSVSSARAGERPSGGALQLFAVDIQKNRHTKRMWMKALTVSAAAATQNIVLIFLVIYCVRLHRKYIS